jgi:hypothetical protein
VLSMLVLWFGPQIVGLFGGVAKQHWLEILGVILGAGCLWWVLRRGRAEAKSTE